MPALTPLESRLASIDEAKAQDVRFRPTVERSPGNTRPPIPQGKVIAEMKALIDSQRK